MRSDQVKITGAMVTMAGALLWLFFSSREAPPKVDWRTHTGLGQVLAEEAAKLVASGGRIVLIARDTKTIRDPAAELQMKGFHEGLRKAKLTLATTNLIKFDPLRLVRMPSGEFVQLLRQHSEGDVIVSLLGPPVLESQQRNKLGEKRPRIVAVCSGAMPAQVNLKELFQENLLHTA